MVGSWQIQSLLWAILNNAHPSFNSNYSQWGSSEYDSSKDVLRVKAQAKTKRSNSKESFGISVNNNYLTIQWDLVTVSAALK